jgi:hypothetical protein
VATHGGNAVVQQQQRRGRLRRLQQQPHDWRRARRVQKRRRKDLQCRCCWQRSDGCRVRVTTAPRHSARGDYRCAVVEARSEPCLDACVGRRRHAAHFSPGVRCQRRHQGESASARVCRCCASRAARAWVAAAARVSVAAMGARQRPVASCRPCAAPPWACRRSAQLEPRVPNRSDAIVPRRVHSTCS